MPRRARIDAPGALHHIIGRGIERRDIFKDDKDRENFLNRLGIILLETETPCFAWTLMSNHFHLLLRTGNVPISTIMRRLLTGYVVTLTTGTVDPVVCSKTAISRFYARKTHILWSL